MLDEPDERPMVSPVHLRRADEMCSLRLAYEHERRRGGLRQRSGDARFAVANRIEGDVRLAHATMRRALPADFPSPTYLAAEQQAVYRAAARGYLQLFGGEEALAADEDVVDPWGIDLDEPFVRLFTGGGIAVVTATRHELRILRVGAAGFGRAPLDDVDLHLAALRTESWVGSGTLRVVVADLLELAVSHVDLELEASRAAARAFVADRVEQIRALVENARPKAGSDCASCGFVPRCSVHRAA